MSKCLESADSGQDSLAEHVLGFDPRPIDLDGEPWGVEGSNSVENDPQLSLTDRAFDARYHDLP